MTSSDNDAPAVPTAARRASIDRLRSHVYTLAGEIGERNVFRPQALDRAANYIESVWQEQGYEVVPQLYEARGIDCRNLEITLTGSQSPEAILLIGAHYDSVHGSPGANDNGTGVAALLEISHLMSTAQPKLSVRFVAFVNEEPPFFYWNNMGSMVYAAMAKRRGDDIRGMVSLETIGYYSDEPRSQRYPPLFSLFYPDQGNFLGFVSNLRSRKWLRRVVSAFRAHSDFPVQSVSMVEWVPGIGWSDHLAFWRQGYPALMVTDTAPYRYPHYHTAADTPDRVDYQSLARVTSGLYGTFLSLTHETD
jgi:Zn-dependent M28 family amino/carboxypeptidase